jgi:hypothetical protein
MDRMVVALPDGSSGEQFRSLRDWLGRESELRGQIVDIEGKPAEHTLGIGVLEALSVGIGSDGAITVLVSGIVSWVRQLGRRRRHGLPADGAPVPTEVTLRFADGGSIEISTATAQAWTTAELSSQIEYLVRAVSARALVSGDTPDTLDTPDTPDGRLSGERR